MRTVLIGANGQLGTDLQRVLAGDIVALDWPEFDIRREEQVRDVLQDHRPDVVINCAAQTNVDLCEDEPAAAFAVNALGALHAARCAEQVGAAVAQVSTDYVFGAAVARPQAYTEEDVPGPINVYGASKLAGE
ncbi:MAG: sugar nucleotide-binding protein, partial [Planctomycetes bacterium]|nr:sugar nucleotide-binding protein [Planctomycetota bacterium]